MGVRRGMSPEVRDYYDVLGVEREADEREIKRAYRAQARWLHPDVSGTVRTRDGFHELVEAYEVLSNPRSRILSDRLGFSRQRRLRAPEEPIAAEVVVRVRVPAGVGDGDRLRVAAVPGLIRVKVLPRPSDPAAVRLAALVLLLVAVGLLVYLFVR